MSIKNQSRLTIFASLIVLGTVAALFAFNFIIDKISKTQAPSFAMGAAPPVPMPNPSIDDSPSNKAQKLGHPGSDDPMPPQEMNQKHGAPANPARRVSSGKNDNSFEKKAPTPPANANQRGGMPPYGMGGGMPPPGMMPQGMPPGGPGGYYPPFPPNMDPQQREMMEQEMERRRDMMYQQGPPDGFPGYYPPGPPPGYPDDGYYNGPEEYYDFESRNDPRRNGTPPAPPPAQLADIDHNEVHVPVENYAAEDFIDDEYLQEYLEEDP